MSGRWRVAFLLSLTLTLHAQAHAFLHHAEPAVGSEIRSVPAELKLWFTEKLEPALCRVQLFGPNGKEIGQGQVHVDPADGALLRLALPALAPGRYHVSWRVVSVDTHVTNGTFEFTVVP